MLVLDTFPHAEWLCRGLELGGCVATLAPAESVHRDRQLLDACLPVSAGLPALVAMVRALLRRRPDAAGLEIDVATRRATLHGETLTLTEQEFQLLHLFANHPGRVFDRETLLTTLWGGRTFVGARTVDALVKRLRHRLHVTSDGRASIQTVRGVGYRFAEMPARPRVLSLLLSFVTLLSQT